jgi:hypothetical protein
MTSDWADTHLHAMEFDVKSDPMCSIRLLGVVFVSFLFSLNLCAEDRLTGISLLTGVAAADQLGVYFFYQGDDNDNSTCHIDYRKMGEMEWRATWRLHADRALKQFHGSLGGLEPETAYEIRLNILDEDGARDTKDLKLKTLPSGAKIPPGWGSEHHYYNDGIGEGQNNSLAGFPNCDSDIHGNIVENVWDDGIESEGGNANVRIWGNFLNECTQAIATRGNARGPVYIWRNVFGKSKWNPKGEKGGYFSKAGFNDPNRGDHGTYIFHNTILQPGGAGKGIIGPVMYAISRNNILDADVSIDYRKKKEAQNAINANDFDYDLVTGKIEVPSGMETERHGRRGNPLYVTGSGFDRKTLKGIFQLAPVSPGFDSGVRIPNFNDLFDGKAPDMGAHESGFTPMEFGPEAARSFPVPIQ